MADDYIPFEKALRELQMSEDELKKLVSQAEIQAIREGDGNIRLRAEDVQAYRERDSMAEELVFADDDLETEAEGMVTALLEEDSLLEEEETLDLDADDFEDEIDAAPGAGAPERNGNGNGIRSRGRAAALRTDDKPEGEESGLDKALVIFSTLMLVYASFVAHSIVKGQSTGMTEWLANIFK